MRGLHWRSIFIATLSAATIATPAQAERWWIVVKQDANGNSHLAESESIDWRSDGRTYVWVHMFFSKPQNGLKSAQIEYSVSCSERTVHEARYVDFDANHDVIKEGDNSATDAPRQPASGSAGELIIRFACGSDVSRTKQFPSINQGVDVWSVGEFFSDPRPIVQSTR